MLLAVCAIAAVAAGCGEDRTSPDRVEAQLEQRIGIDPQFVECDRSGDQADRRYTCRVETSTDRFRYVATCPDPGRACVIRRTGVELK
jgi:hypothetical protein